ncbi:hypothetical protein ACYOEI_31195 [Singulisphaera rosea]
MAKKLATKHVESEERQEELTDVGSAISKAEAIRRALAEGLDMPEEGTEFIRKNFGLEVSKPHFSATKSQIKSRVPTNGDAHHNGSRIRGSRPFDGFLAPPSKSLSGGEADLLAAMEALKPLVAILGAEKVKRIADLLG